MVSAPYRTKLLPNGYILIPNLNNLAETQFPVPSGALSKPYINDEVEKILLPVTESVY